MAKCPICGSHDEDLVFKFWCCNPHCQNFNRQAGNAARQEPKESAVAQDVTVQLRCLWQRHGDGLSEEAFLLKFFTAGGRFGLTPGGMVVLKVVPGWLKTKGVKA